MGCEMCLFLLIFLRCGFDVLCASDWYVMSTTVWIHWIWYYDIIYFLRWTIKNKDTIFWFIPFHTPQQQALQTDTGYFSSISHLPMSVNVFQRTFFCLFFLGGLFGYHRVQPEMTSDEESAISNVSGPSSASKLHWILTELGRVCWLRWS